MTATQTRPQLVTVFGGSGFVGRYVVRELAARGYRVRAACRRPDLAGHLQPLGNVGQIHPVQANLRHQWSIERAVDGADHVINLVGILAESGRQSFDNVQARGAGWVSQAAAAAGASMLQVSAIGADADSEVGYARTKGEGERLALDSMPNATIVRPSIVFGPEDDFFNRFAGMARLSPFLPLIGGGKTQFQPVYVADVAHGVVDLMETQQGAGQVFEFGGPRQMSFRECLELMLEVIDRKRLFLSLPFGVASTLAKVMQFAPGAPLTPGQVAMLRHDNVVSDAAAADGRTLAGLGVTPQSASVILPRYLVRFRKHGQFEATRGL